MRTVLRVAVVMALCTQAACTEEAAPAAPSGHAPAQSSPGAPPSKQVDLDCSDPIDTVSSPTRPYGGVLDVVGLHITSTLQVRTADGTAPHRLFAKTGLLVHAGREANLTVPPDWAARVSIGWGTNTTAWTTRLHIPACPAPPAPSGQWLAFPGGFSLDKAACVPLQVHKGNETTTVHVSVGAPCPS